MYGGTGERAAEYENAILREWGGQEEIAGRGCRGPSHRAHVALNGVAKEKLLRVDAAGAVDVDLSAGLDPPLKCRLDVGVDAGKAWAHGGRKEARMTNVQPLCGPEGVSLHAKTYWPLTAPSAYACCHMWPCNCLSAPTFLSCDIIQRTDCFVACSAALLEEGWGDGDAGACTLERVVERPLAHSVCENMCA
jgi:hypothetical protein